MTATEFVLFQENKRLKAENDWLKANAGPQNIFSASTEPAVQPMRTIKQTLNIAVQTYCRDDGYGYHVIGRMHSGLHVAYYVDRTALALLNDWSMGDMMKKQLEQVSMALVNALAEKGLPTLAQNLDHSP
jgi:hypothetical protein